MTEQTIYKPQTSIISGAGAFYPLTSADQVIVDEQHKLSEIFDLIYPVGSIYLSTNQNINPNVIFGGIWEIVPGRFLLGTGKPNANEYDGWGAETARL